MARFGAGGWLVRRGHLIVLLLAPALLLASACSSSGGSGNGDDADAGGSGDQQSVRALTVAVASYELVANQDNRLIAGLLTVGGGGIVDGDFVSYGTVEMSFSYLGDGQTAIQPEFFKEVQAGFLPIPGEERADAPTEPVTGPASEGRGVYAAYGVDFDRAGFWQVDVTAVLQDGTELKGASAFQVYDKPQVPAPGEPAPASDSYTVDSDVPPAAIDSRATSVDDVPDAALHQVSIADALRLDKPVVVLFSTPVFCVSRFCGPVTDMVEALQQQYGDGASFIHVEIWQDFNNRQITPAALEWLFRNQNLQEPWLFLIGKDGTILQRWDNVVTPDEVRPALEQAIQAS